MTVHVVPEDDVQPYQPVKVAPSAGIAVRVATSPFATGSVQSPVDPVVHWIPVPTTVPTPETSTVSTYVAGWNVAVTVFAANTFVTLHVVPETLEHPDHDLKIASGAGVALSAMLPPFATGSLQSPVDPVVQEIPGPSIVPLPLTTAVSV